MKVQFISEPEWAEGKEVTLEPDSYNITGLTESEYKNILSVVTGFGVTLGIDSARVAVSLFDADKVSNTE